MRALASSLLPVSTVHLSSFSSVRVCMRYLSLSELAKAFTEMSESDNAGNTVGAPLADAQRSRMAEDVKGAVSKNNPLASGNMKWNKGLRLGGNNSSTGVVTFSTAYSNLLSSMTASQLLRMLVTECKRVHHGHIIQCLVEVWSRLRKAPPLEIIISDDEARGETVDTTASSSFSSVATSTVSWHFRSDALLEGVLRALAKTNLEGVQKSNVWATGFNSVDHNANSMKEWVTEFSRLVIDWLTTRAASLNAACSVTFLHLIAQQRLLHCDAVLETLRDNIEVHLRKQHSLCTSVPLNAVEALSVSGFAVLLDAVARWQIGFLRVLRVDGVASRYLLDTNSMTEATTRYRHPILNPRFYDVVVSGLLRGVRDGSLHLTRQGSPTTFLFLILALAKIRWFRADCVEVLLPQLHEALTVFPAQFFAVVLLLGRREVKTCAIETTDLLLQILLDAMQKRGRRYDAVDTRRRHKTDAASVIVAASSQIEPASMTSLNFTINDEMFSRTTTTPYADDNIYDGDISGDNDDDLQLFSTSSLTSLDDGNTTTFSKDNENKHTENTVENSSVPRMVFTTSFIDIRSMPVFLESLHHIVSTTHAYCETHACPTQWNVLNSKSKTLYEALLNDTHASVKSIDSLIASPDLVEKLLRAVLCIPRDDYHPLLVELAYVFTRHVSMRHVSTTTATAGVDDGSKKNKATTPMWQRRVLGLVDMLVSRGILTPEAYVMREEVISTAPRVVEEVETEKKRILERYCERQERLEGKSVNVERRKVRLGAVFSKFSRVVRKIKEQEKPLS